MKNNFHIVILSLVTVLFFSGCIKQPEPYDYSTFLHSKPRSILVLMPVNQSLEPKASSAVLANSIYPLSEAGYYIFPVAMVYDTFKHNGISEPSEIRQVSLHKLKEIFGADAVLYMDVKEYGSSYVIVDSITKVSIKATLVDIHTGNKLWEKEATASDQSQNSNGIIGILVTALVKQIVNSVLDQGFNVSVVADNILFSTNCHDCILLGPYSPKYGQDTIKK